MIVDDGNKSRSKRSAIFDKDLSNLGLASCLNKDKQLILLVIYTSKSKPQTTTEKKVIKNTEQVKKAPNGKPESKTGQTKAPAKPPGNKVPPKSSNPAPPRDPKQ